MKKIVKKIVLKDMGYLKKNVLNAMMIIAKFLLKIVVIVTNAKMDFLRMMKINANQIIMIMII